MSLGIWEWLLHITWDTEKIIFLIFYYGATFNNILFLFNYIYIAFVKHLVCSIIQKSDQKYSK